jgi:hypothetical protein
LQHAALAHLSSSSSASRCRMQRLGMRAMASAAVATRAGPPAPPKDQVLTQDPNNNVTEYIYSKMGINLHHQPNHPIGIIKQVGSCVSVTCDFLDACAHGHLRAWTFAVQHAGLNSIGLHSAECRPGHKHSCVLCLPCFVI